MFDLVIGCGQGGARIAKQFSDVYECPGRYLNLAVVDFKRFPVSRSHMLVLDEGGTGRDPEVGEELVRDRFDEDVAPFIADALELTHAEKVLIAVGGGGGSGVGFLFPLLEYLVDDESSLKVFLVFTLPQFREGLPAQPNALIALSRLIEEEYLDQVTMMLVDNDYCFDRYGQRGGYWDRVNKGIAYALKRFYNATKSSSKGISAVGGFGTLDYREFEKLLLFKHGFLDIREFVLHDLKEVSELRKTVKSSSLLSGSMNINTTKAYIVSVVLPLSWEVEGVNEMVQEIFSEVAKMTRTPYVLQSSYFSDRIEKARVSLLLAGVTKSHSLDKHIKRATKNVEKFKEKGDVEAIDVSGLEY